VSLTEVVFFKEASLWSNAAMNLKVEHCPKYYSTEHYPPNKYSTTHRKSAQYRARYWEHYCACVNKITVGFTPFNAGKLS